MPYIMGLLGILIAGAFWWFRIRGAGQAAGEIADAVDQVQGKIRRRRFLNKADLSPIAAINDPVTAAATVMMAIAAEDRPVSQALADRVRAEVKKIAWDDKVLDEAMVYAKWASSQIADVLTVINATADLLNRRLDDDEKEHLVSMVLAVTPVAERQPTFPQRITLLRRNLHLAG